MKAVEIGTKFTDRNFLKKAYEIVQNNISNDAFTVTIFCSEIAMGRATLHRKLKSLTGKSTTEFIRSIRIKRAAELLHRKYLRIDEVAFQVGFKSVSYFTKCFKKEYGITPSEFVRNNVAYG